MTDIVEKRLDIVERLRDQACNPEDWDGLMDAAADEITRLRAEVDFLTRDHPQMCVCPICTKALEWRTTPDSAALEDKHD